VRAVSLADALERAASALPDAADAIRPANGDPRRLLASLDAAAAARVLEWLLVHEPEAGGELALAYADETEGAAALLRLRDAELPRPARKELGRALHRLRSRGVAAPPAGLPEGRVATLAPVQDELGGSFVSALDPMGARLVVLLEPNPAGGARLFELVVDEAAGVLECHVYTSGRRDARRFLRALTERKSLEGVEVPPEAVRALLARVAGRRDPERPPARAFDEWRSHLTAGPPGARTPGDLVRDALGDAQDPAALEPAAAELVRRGTLGPWPPPRAVLERLAERIREAAQGRVIVSGAARSERIREALDACLADVFAGEAAAAHAARFRESAYVAWKMGRADDARAALAAARAFEERPAGENPVARALLEKVLGPFLQSLEAEEPQSLIARP
jgi:hypothetical protein